MLKDGILYKRNFHGIYLQCLEKEEAQNILEEFHNKVELTMHQATLEHIRYFVSVIMIVVKLSSSLEYTSSPRPEWGLLRQTDSNFRVKFYI